jgi:hypothetical protein
MTLFARLWVALAWCAVVLVAAVLTLLFWPFLRPVFVGERRRGIAPRSHRTEQLLAECALAAESAPITGPESDQRDPGDETDVVTEGLGVSSVHPLHHHVTPIEGLTKGERELWDDVRRRVTP